MQSVSKEFLCDDMFKHAFEHSAVGLAHLTPGGEFIAVNRRLCQLLGYSANEMKRLKLEQIVPSDETASHQTGLQQILSGEKTEYTQQGRFAHKTGHLIDATLTVSVVQDDAHTAMFLVATLTEASPQQTRLMARSDHGPIQFEDIVESLADLMVVWIADPSLEQMLYVNKGFERIWGRSKEALMGSTDAFFNAIHGEDKVRVMRYFAAEKRGNWQVDYRIVRPDGTVRYIQDRGFTVSDKHQKVAFLVGTALDKTEDYALQQRLVASHEKLKCLSAIDCLTGCYNRRAIIDKVTEEFQRFRREGSPATLAFIDLNKFKSINDKFGHVAGDEALKVFANQVSGQLRDTDSFGRYGGDEFILLLTGTSQKNATQFLERLALNTIKVESGEQGPFEFSCSVGLSTLHSSINSPEAWIKAADEQMYRHKTKFPSSAAAN